MRREWKVRIKRARWSTEFVSMALLRTWIWPFGKVRVPLLVHNQQHSAGVERTLVAGTHACIPPGLVTRDEWDSLNVLHDPDIPLDGADYGGWLAWSSGAYLVDVRKLDLPLSSFVTSLRRELARFVSGSETDLLRERVPGLFNPSRVALLAECAMISTMSATNGLVVRRPATPAPKQWFVGARVAVVHQEFETVDEAVVAQLWMTKGTIVGFDGVHTAITDVPGHERVSLAELVPLEVADPRKLGLGFSRPRPALAQPARVKRSVRPRRRRRSKE